MKPRVSTMKNRWRFAGVRNHSIQDAPLALAFSASRGYSISAISKLTSGDVSSPSALYLVRMARPSRVRPCHASHLGDSGVKKVTSAIWKTDDAAWRTEGSRQL